MGKVRGGIFLIFFLIILIGNANASFSIGNISHSITKEYGSFGKISGWVNISFKDEMSNSILRDSLGNSITLSSLLKLNNGAVYNCSVLNCEKDYSASNGQQEKIFSLENGASSLVGVRFNQDIQGINSLNFTIESDATKNCFNQIEVDLFNDGQIDTGNTKPSVSFCNFLTNRGCFDESRNDLFYNFVGTFPNKHCQRMNLSNSPGFFLGAWTNNSLNLEMALYDLSDMASPLRVCSLQNNMSGHISCNVSYLVTEKKEFYVCIYSKDSKKVSKIRGYQVENGCGFYGVDIGNEAASFDIFAIGTEFGDVGNLTLNLPAESIQNYLETTYGSLDCSKIKCILPIKIFSKMSQTIKINNLKADYETKFGPTSETSIYDLKESPAKINAGFQKIFLDDGNLTLPKSYGNLTYKLLFNETEIFSEKIFLEKIPEIKGISPTQTASAFPTNFEADVSADGEVSEYNWDFGDGDTKLTTLKNVIHTYNQTGIYQITLSVKDTKGRSSEKSFEIYVNSPDKMINLTLNKMERDFANVQLQLRSFDEFSQESLKSVLNINELDDALKKAELDYRSAYGDEELLNSIVGNLLRLKVPESVKVTSSSDFVPLLPIRENINLDVLSKISQSEYDSEKETDYIDAIIAWNLENVLPKAKYKEFSAKYNKQEEHVLKLFELNIAEKGDVTDNYFLIIKNMSNLRFEKNYFENEEQDYVYIELKGDKNNFIFSTTEDTDFTQLPFFISPSVERLKFETVIITPLEPSKKWTYFTYTIIGLIILGTIIYFALQQWYKYRYEKYLFKDRNNLYNLLIYVDGQRKKGVGDKYIKDWLKKSGWNSEQIAYAMKKYAGKRTGMFEFSFGKSKDTGVTPQNKEAPINSKFQQRKF